MKLRFSQYAEHKQIEIGKNTGNEINAVRVRNCDGSIRYTQTFRDSRLADEAIRDALTVVAAEVYG